MSLVSCVVSYFRDYTESNIWKQKVLVHRGCPYFQLTVVQESYVIYKNFYAVIKTIVTS